MIYAVLRARHRYLVLLYSHDVIAGLARDNPGVVI